MLTLHSVVYNILYIILYIYYITYIVCYIDTFSKNYHSPSDAFLLVITTGK